RRMRSELLQDAVGQIDDVAVDDSELPAVRELLQLLRQLGAGLQRHDDARDTGQPIGSARQLTIHLVLPNVRARDALYSGAAMIAGRFGAERHPRNEREEKTDDCEKLSNESRAQEGFPGVEHDGA